MSIRNKPNYGIYTLSLNAAGTQDLPILGTRIVFVTARDAGGVLAPNALVNVLIGRSLGDAIPFSPNTKINVDAAFEYARLTWAAQAGITATFLVADDRDGEGVNVDAPVASLTVAGAITDNVTQFANNPVQTGGGASGVGIPRITVANDSGLNPLPNGQQANKLGGSFFSNAALTAGAAVTVVTAASNVNGVILRKNGYLFNAGSARVVVTAGTVAPTSATSNACLLMAGSGATSAALSSGDLFLPAGQGLYVWADGGATSGAFLNYDVL